jgi:hypothetical protein
LAVKRIPPGHPLYGSWLKCRRAQQHISGLDKSIKAFLKNRPYQIAEERLQLKSFEATEFHVQRSGRPSDMWGPIIGDIAHNLRSALDYIPFALAISSGYDGDKRPRPAFPVFGCSANYHQRRGGAADLFCHVPARAREVFEYFQPYHSGDRPEQHRLLVLNELSNKDKHRLVTPVFLGSNLALYPGYSDPHGLDAPGIREDYRVIITDKLRDHIQVPIEPRVVVDVAFDIPYRPELSPIGIGELRAIHELIRDDVISRFTRFFK